ncbi:hypothetical protein FB566_0876 [Stackebrandtia endophytica]|uniref:Uncharacterized protein n=1 Tax=Stackebrandtia endophytica TaxID=1496996 RepID=A0A543AS94_9ACTN|nr:hypothetical protein [Stackebrandtia endophytica]TQL75375.1 hypothetical protein FB566_0876 [Stackebrandtia endophytica]
MTVLEPDTRAVVIGVGTAWQRGDMTAAIVVRKWGPRRYRVRWQDRILSTIHTSTVPRVDIRLPDRELLRLFAED